MLPALISPRSCFAPVSASLAVCLALFVQPAQAQVTQYTSRASFDANSVITTTQDFSGIAPTNGFVSYLPTNTVALGGFTFTQTKNSSNAALSAISSSYYKGAGGQPDYNLGNGDFLQAGFGAPSQFTISLPGGTTAFGLDVGTFAAAGGQVTAILSNGTTFVFGNSFPNVSFFGFTSTTAITSLTLTGKADSTSNNSLNIDTLEAGRAIPAVPEVSTTVSLGLLLTLGLGGMAVAAKRRKVAVNS